jgi:gluconolactonase
VSPYVALLVVLGLQATALLAQVVPRVIANVDSYGEGVVFDTTGDAYVSVLHREAVYRIRGTQAPAVWFRVKEPNGHKILADGSHLIAARGGIYHLAPDARLLEVVGQQIASPNDLALDGDGGVYISAPAERADDQRALRSKVYYLDSAG